ncbi:MAG: hypothetical protein IT437_00830 [Phycisphaerales bacterium]|nr:hypothetical protein [Phycisphaerales bacterium]
MSGLLDRLFGLSGLRFGAEGVSLDLAHPIPAWGWALIALAGIGIASWSYWRLTGARWARALLAAGRALLLLLLVLLIAGPRLTRPNERIEKDWVLVLVDRSASMSIPDAPGGVRRTREAQLRDILSSLSPALGSLGDERTVVWLGFDGGAYDLKTTAGAPDLAPPTGRRTSLASALDQALQRAAARPVSGVVVLSDGRSIDEPSRAALRRLQADHIPVHTIALGSPVAVADLAIVAAEAPRIAYVNDTVPIQVRIESLGDAGTPPDATVQLVDKATGGVLAEQAIDPASWSAGVARVVLTTKPGVPGAPTWLVRVVPARPDLIGANDTAEVHVELVDRPIRVAYFDGYPRWEQRYLKNLLLREKSISSASLLLASNRRYLHEGDIPLAGPPRSPEEWASFDVIIMGDVPAGMFSREQLEQIKDHVAVRGAGLLWVGGPGSTPGSWRGTPLADLLPFSMPTGDDRGLRAWEEPVTTLRADAAERLGVLQLAEGNGWPAGLTDPQTGWSQLRWAQRIDPRTVKPTAEVLAWAVPVSGAATPEPGPPGAPPAGAAPLVLTMSYGAGRIIYVATDEIWRWRYARGEALPERFWLPLIRLQGRQRLARSSRAAILEASPRRAEVGQTVRVWLEMVDQALVDSAGRAEGLGVRATRVDADPGQPEAPTTLRLLPEHGDGGADAPSRLFSTLWLPPQAGRYRLEPIDPVLAGLGLATDAEIALSDDELRHPETNHPLLERLSSETGGRVIAPDQAAHLTELLPRRELHIAGTPDIEPLWDKPVVLAALIILLTAEWVGRRVIKLS